LHTGYAILDWTVTSSDTLLERIDIVSQNLGTKLYLNYKIYFYLDYIEINLFLTVFTEILEHGIGPDHKMHICAKEY